VPYFLRSNHDRDLGLRRSHSQRRSLRHSDRHRYRLLSSLSRLLLSSHFLVLIALISVRYRSLLPCLCQRL
jgi:hypothetical protein